MRTYHDFAAHSGVVLPQSGVRPLCGGDLGRSIHECMEIFEVGFRGIGRAKADRCLTLFPTVGAHALWYSKLHRCDQGSCRGEGWIRSCHLRHFPDSLALGSSRLTSGFSHHRRSQLVRRWVGGPRFSPCDPLFTDVLFLDRPHSRESTLTAATTLCEFSLRWRHLPIGSEASQRAMDDVSDTESTSKGPRAHTD